MCKGDTYKLSTNCTMDGGSIISGTCSKETEDRLTEDKCFKNGYEQQFPIQNSIMLMISNSCSDKVTQSWINRIKNLDNTNFFSDKRINPVTNIGDGFKTRIPYENTRNRYPWICSLRTHGINPDHLCSVTLLSKPPQPTIIIGPAHCTLLCKDRGRRMPSCCCLPEGVDSCRTDRAKCGKDARVGDMLPEEVDIVCGEWETGPVPMTVSMEKYNVILSVTEIIIHEKYDKQKGPSSGNDIAIFKVDDGDLKTGD